MLQPSTGTRTGSALTQPWACQASKKMKSRSQPHRSQSQAPGESGHRQAHFARQAKAKQPPTKDPPASKPKASAAPVRQPPQPLSSSPGISAIRVPQLVGMRAREALWAVQPVQSHDPWTTRGHLSTPAAPRAPPQPNVAALQPQAKQIPAQP